MPGRPRVPRSAEHTAKIAAALRHTELPATKVCSKCKKELPGDRFGRRSEFVYKSACRACENEASKAWKAAHPETVQRNNRKGAFRRRGITETDYLSMLEAQGGGCAVCSEQLPRLDVDHRHRDGLVRGLLCSPCNRAIGLMQDDPDRLIAAAAYLNR